MKSKLSLVYRCYASGRKAKCILSKNRQEIISLEYFEYDGGLQKYNVYGLGEYEYIDMSKEEYYKCILEHFYDKEFIVPESVVGFNLRDIKIYATDLLSAKEIRKLKLILINKKLW